MAQQVAYFPLGGGLDLTTPAIAAKPGTARAALNYESDLSGYRRMTGYERYDGRTSPTDAYNAAADAAAGAIARDAARAAIQAVPGSGQIRGVWWYNGVLYAFRNNPGGTNCVMWKATVGGWVSVYTTFPPGGSYEFVNYNFTGNGATVMMYGVNGVGQGFQFDGTTVTLIAVAGMAADTPFKVAAHKNHLFFAYPGGSLQHSGIGTPLTWTAVTGASELAMGDEITDLISAAPTSLIIMAKNSVSALYGNDTSDWQLQSITNEAGAIAHTAQKMGPVIYMDNRGIRKMDTTASYGDFTLGTMTQTVAPLLRSRLTTGQSPVASVRVRTRDTYRVFWSDGTGLSVYIGKKNPEVMPIDLGIPITCACSAETTNAIEQIWFGSTNGFVYQMDKGRSFDGVAMNYHLRLPFNHHNAPHTIKRWHRAVVEYAALGNATLSVTGEVNYADPAEPALANQNASLSGGGGFWDAVSWDQFYWSAPVEGKSKVYIDGVGESMSLLLGGSAVDEEPHTLQGLTLFYSARGMSR